MQTSSENRTKTIICLDNSEFNLHKISEELKILKEKSKLNTLMRFELVSVNDIDLLKSIFTSNQIDTIYHAAVQTCTNCRK